MNEKELFDYYKKIEAEFTTVKNLKSVTSLNLKTDAELFSLFPAEGKGAIGVQEQGWSSAAVIIARHTVCNKVIAADKMLKSKHPELQLMVVNGYRSLETQKEKFAETLKEIGNNFKSEDDKIEAAHRGIAEPTVAGHPTVGDREWAFDNRRKEYLYTQKDIKICG